MRSDALARTDRFDADLLDLGDDFANRKFTKHGPHSFHPASPRYRSRLPASRRKFDARAILGGPLYLGGDRLSVFSGSSTRSGALSEGPKKNACGGGKCLPILERKERGENMDVSKGKMKSPVDAVALNTDSELLSEVANLTGLPVDWVESELTQIVKKSGHTPEQLTLEELRASMLEYLEEMNREMNAQEAADLDMLENLTIPNQTSH